MWKDSLPVEMPTSRSDDLYRMGMCNVQSLKETEQELIEDDEDDDDGGEEVRSWCSWR